MNRTSAGVGISLGLCFGAALGAATHNVGVGVALGVAFGGAFATIFGAFEAASTRRRFAADKPLPNPLGLFERDKSD